MVCDSEASLSTVGQVPQFWSARAPGDAEPDRWVQGMFLGTPAHHCLNTDLEEGGCSGFESQGSEFWAEEVNAFNS